MKKLIFLLLIPLFLYGQDGTRKAWIDTLYVSSSGVWTDITSISGGTSNISVGDSIDLYGYAVPIWQNLTIADSAAGDTALDLFGGNQWHVTSYTDWETKLDLYYNVNKKLYGFYFWYDASNLTGLSTGYIRIWIGTGTAMDTASYPMSTDWQYNENGTSLLAYTDTDAGTLPASKFTYRIRIQIKTSALDGNFFVRPYSLEAIYYVNRVGDF